MLSQVLPTVWVSDRAVIGRGVLLGQNSRIWGPVWIGDGCVIDDGVQIGYPSPKEQSTAREALSSQSASPLPLDRLDDFVMATTRIGERSVIRSGAVIYSGSELGPGLDCAHFATIREGCRMGSGVYIKVATEIRRDATIGDDCVLAGTVADRSILGDGVTCLGHLVHKYSSGQRGQLEAAPHLSNRCFVGRRACVIGGVSLGESCYVAAGAIVTFDVPARALVRSEKGTVVLEGSPL